jgi:tRNA pseudouridine38-40 synthase
VDPQRQRFLLTIAYDGSGFHGWQKQEPPDKPALRTVQGVLEDVLQRLLGQRLSLLGASRTDAGVHALGQRGQFDAVCPIPVERLAEAINSRLPKDVEVRDVTVVHDHFDVINMVRSKQYCYRIHNTTQRPLEKRLFVWHGWIPLDVDRMNNAAHRLVGTHDFGGFAAAGHGRLSTVRSIFNCWVQRDEPGKGNEVHMVVEGDGFLYNMVRIIAGTLVEVGRGHFEPDVIDKIIKAADRAMAGPTLPPEGLWLQWIKY